MAVEVYLPKMSDHMESGRIIRWLVNEGERVERGQVILELETDKAVGELEAPDTGVLKGVRAGAGEEIPVGETIAYIARPDEKVPSLPPFGIAGSQAPAVEKIPTEVQTGKSSSRDGGPVPATPVARRVAKELGVDIEDVKGSGPGGRVREEDVRAYFESLSTTPTAPEPPPVSAPAIGPSFKALPMETPPEAESELIPLTQIQAITGQRMLESVQNAPHFFLQVRVDMSKAMEIQAVLRERILAETGENLTITAILVKVVAVALKRYPRANSTYENGSVRILSQVNIGVAVGAEQGLVVPVIKSAAVKSLAQITTELKQFQVKAVDLRFSVEDLSGGTFTISNLGMYGVDVFTAIINPPQSAILAVGQIIKTPAAMPDDTIALRPMMAMTLSVDHRSMDGMQAARFLGEVKILLEQPYFLL